MRARVRERGRERWRETANNKIHFFAAARERERERERKGIKEPALSLIIFRFR